jgi:hypothetical protein
MGNKRGWRYFTWKNMKKRKGYFNGENKCFWRVGFIERFPVQCRFVKRKRVPQLTVVVEILFFVKLYLKRKVVEGEKERDEFMK